MISQYVSQSPPQRALHSRKLRLPAGESLSAIEFLKGRLNNESSRFKTLIADINYSASSVRTIASFLIYLVR